MKNRIKYLNRAELSFPSLSQNESLARSFASAFMMQPNPTIDAISDVKCAVSEAVTNSIVHGYRNTKGEIKVKCRLTEDLTLIIDIIDKGCGIEDIDAACEPLFTTNSDGERSGMGFTVMKTLTDNMKVYSKPGRGTRVRLIKKLSDDT